MPTPRPQTLEQVKALLRRDLKLGPDVQISDDMPFFGSEIDLDSLDILLLMSSIEKQFGIKIPSEAVGKEVFQNVRTLATYLEEHANLGAGSAPPAAIAAPSSADLLNRLPHREPFRFLSKIIEIRPGESGSAVWSLTGAEAFFAGHFPGNPIVPGVLIGEALAQLSGLVGPETGGRGGMLAQLDLRFQQPARPPVDIQLESKLVRAMGELQQFQVTAKVGDSIIAQGNLALYRPASIP
jgi:3-hydroxyacyl-[acyl-carrier-protein] dehydratase